MKIVPFAKPNKKPSVIFALESSGLSGGVRVIFQQANWLVKHGWSVTFFSLGFKPDWFQLDTRIVWEQFMIPQEIEAALRYTPPSVLKVATWWNTVELVARGSHENEGSYFVQDQEASYYPQSEARQRKVEDTYSNGLSIYTDSTYAQKWLEERQIPSEYVGLWTENDRFVYDPDTRYRILVPVVMSLVRRQALKGFPLFCETARKMERQLHVWSLVTFGRGTMSKVVPHHSHISSPTDEQVAEIYAKSSVVLCSSIHEGTGLTILEAWLSGCPVVTTACGGNESFCVSEENCLMVPLSPDSATELADAVTRLLKDRALSKRLAEAGYETARALFSYKVVAPRLESYFDRRWKEIS